MKVKVMRLKVKVINQSQGHSSRSRSNVSEDSCRVDKTPHCGQKNSVPESRSRQPVVDRFATILTPAHNFLATIWPFIDILQSLVVYVNHHKKTISGKLLVIGFAATMQLLSNNFTSCSPVICQMMPVFAWS